MNTQLNSAFFSQNTVQVARQLLGKRLCTADTEAEIIETEAYREDDPACHAFGGRQSQRNASMFGPPGTIYVYRIHQVFCLNISTEAAGYGSAVLIRALRPLSGIAAMQKRRPVAVSQLLNGPGKLCQALGIDLSWNGHPLGEQLWLAEGENYPDAQILSTARIGISKAQERLWRFVLLGRDAD